MQKITLTARILPVAGTPEKSKAANVEACQTLFKIGAITSQEIFIRLLEIEYGRNA